MLIINQSTRLCFLPSHPFMAGEWEIEIATQYNRSYRPYKQPRKGSLTFTVREPVTYMSAALLCCISQYSYAAHPHTIRINVRTREG